MYPVLISLVIIFLMLISPRKDISTIMDSSAGKFFMIVFLILAIGQNLFLGLFVLVLFIYLLTPNTREGMTSTRAKTSTRPESTRKINENDPRKENDESDVSKTEEKVDNSDSNDNSNNIELSPEELAIVRNLIQSKQTNPKQKCRKNCGNALLSCLDGCQVSEQMRRPVSSKDVNVTNNTGTTENVEPTDEATKEGFATFEQNYMPL